MSEEEVVPAGDEATGEEMPPAVAPMGDDAEEEGDAVGTDTVGAADADEEDEAAEPAV